MIALLAATPVCLFLGVASGAGGHGNYLLAKVLFPFTMLSAVLSGAIDTPFMVLAVAQHPLYGAILGLASKRGRLRRAAVGVFAVHALVAAVCVFVPNENFSHYERSSAIVQP